MAYNMQMPNNAKFVQNSYLSRDKRRSMSRKGSAFSIGGKHHRLMYNHMQEIAKITPSLCFQSDVFYPNALAAVSGISCEEDCFAMGCRGNQIQKDFTLGPRVPVTVPLVQYFTPTESIGSSLDNVDICAKPVLNWETYVLSALTCMKPRFRRAGATKYSKDSKRHEPVAKPRSDKSITKRKAKRREKRYEHLPEEDRPPIEEDSGTEPSSESDGFQTNDTSESELDDDDINMERKYRKRVWKSAAYIRNKLFRDETDLTMTEKERRQLQKEKKLDRLACGKKAKSSKPQKKQKLKLGWLRKKYLIVQKDWSQPKLPLGSLRTFKNLPKLRIEGTWNHIYGGARGACSFVQNQSQKDKNIDVYVGMRSQVRKITLEKALPSSMLTYKLKSVWDEDMVNVPTNNRPGHVDPLSDIVFEIVPLKKVDTHIIGVRRGRSVELYGIEEESPYLLDCIPNICYGSREYDGWRKRKHFDVIKDPLLLGLDFNMEYLPEFITIDENMQIRIGDFSKGETVSTYYVAKQPRVGPNLKQFPNFKRVNDASGISFRSNGQTFLAWADSKIVLGDRRDSAHSRASLIDIFDLRRPVSSMAWSDQSRYVKGNMEVNDYVSSLKSSLNENYYYVGTKSRIIMLDVRVPGQPVLKMEHGMLSAASYLDIYTDDSFEVIVAANQRVPATFCALTDHAHVSCFNRPGCEAKNPVLSCLPRHLSSSMEFFDTAVSRGYFPAWDADFNRARDHNYAWTTGLAICKGPVQKSAREPPGILVFTSNCYGDVFLQEWEQKPVEPHRQTRVKDYKFTELLKQWSESMQSTSMTEFQMPSLNTHQPVDCSLLIEPCARNIKKMTKVRHDEFDPFKPNEIVYRHAEEHQITVEDRIKQLRVYKSDVAQRVLDVWEKDIGHAGRRGSCADIKQEPLERGSGYVWNADGTWEVEILHFNPQERRAVVDLENQIQNEVSIANSLQTGNREQSSDNDDDEDDDDGDEREELLSSSSSSDGKSGSDKAKLSTSNSEITSSSSSDNENSNSESERNDSNSDSSGLKYHDTTVKKKGNLSRSTKKSPEVCSQKRLTLRSYQKNQTKRNLIQSGTESPEVHTPNSMTSMSNKREQKKGNSCQSGAKAVKSPEKITPIPSTSGSGKRKLKTEASKAYVEETEVLPQMPSDDDDDNGHLFLDNIPTSSHRPESWLYPNPKLDIHEDYDNHPPTSFTTTSHPTDGYAAQWSQQGEYDEEYNDEYYSQPLPSLSSGQAPYNQDDEYGDYWSSSQPQASGSTVKRDSKTKSFSRKSVGF